MKYYGKNGILQEIKELSKKKQVILVCIGTDKHVWDSLGPMVGSMLEDYYEDIIIYGSLNEPVTAINVEDLKHEIDIIHSSDLVIAIDIAVTSKKELNKKVYVRRGGIKPGIGVGIKNLSLIGDYSILYYVYQENLNNKRIRNPYNGALEIVNIIKNIIDN